MTRATRITVSNFGFLVGLAGIKHGISQGPLAKEE
jgi:hypothetical protein